MLHSLETNFQARKDGLSPGLDVYSNRIHSSTQFGRSELRRGLKRSLSVRLIMIAFDFKLLRVAA